MIDLHMHTTYSDGDYNLRQLIDILKQENILYASITDHNCVDAHIEYENKNYKNLWEGKMIKGVELQTIVDPYIIEVLVYDYDLEKFKKYINLTRASFWEFHHNAYQKLLLVADQLGLKYIEPKRDLGNGYYANMKFQDAIKACYDENIKLVSHEVLTDINYFYRNEFLNEKSDFYIDTKCAFPKLEDVIKHAHDCHGKVFLAHIEEYKNIKNKMDFLNDLISNFSIDGIECFHPSISEEHRKKYMEFANNHHLLISAGSDFHGPHLEYRNKINTDASLNDISWLKIKE